MRYAFIADVHANLEALTAVLADIAPLSPDRIVCLGDMVGYGPDPRACLALLREKQVPMIAGNHDLAVCNRLTTQYFHSEAQASVRWTQDELSEEDKTFLSGLSLLGEADLFMAAHGTLYRPEMFEYILSVFDAQMSFEAFEVAFGFVGHSHVPAMFVQDGDRIEILQQPEVTVPEPLRAIVNVGSVGQPRDGNPKAAYVLFDTETRVVNLRRVAYDIDCTVRKILATRLPPINAYRLVEGQ
jgi:diadenosine tetraphosphatase ApaH/serine/threonine PP2A family protein phosphatase